MDPGPTVRPHAWAAALVLVALGTLFWSVQDYWDPKPDAAHYIVAARSLARGEGYALFGEPFTKRPPGFSVLLAPVVALRGADFAALNLFVSLVGIGAVVLWFLHLRERVPPALAFTAAAALWPNAEFQRGCNQVMSDVPSLAAALAALALIRRSGERPALSNEIAAGVAIAAAVYVRTANLVLLPAFVLDRLAARGAGGPARARRLLVPLAVAGALYAPWLAWSATRPPATDGYGPQVDSYLSASFWSLPDDLRDPADAETRLWAHRLRRNVAGYSSLLGSFLATPSGPVATRALGLLVAAAVFWQLARRRGAAEWFTAGTLVLLLVYPALASRLALTGGILAFGSALQTMHEQASRRMPPRRATVLVSAAAIAAGLVAFDPRFMPVGRREEFAHLQQACRHVAQAASPTDRVGGDVGPIYAVLLDRPVATVRAVPRRLGLRGTLEAIDRFAVRHVIVRQAGPGLALVRHAATSGWPVHHFGSYAVVEHPSPRAPQDGSAPRSR